MTRRPPGRSARRPRRRRRLGPAHGAHVERAPCRGHGQEVEVVVVEPGQDGATVERRGPRARRPAAGRSRPSTTRPSSTRTSAGRPSTSPPRNSERSHVQPGQDGVGVGAQLGGGAGTGRARGGGASVDRCGRRPVGRRRTRRPGRGRRPAATTRPRPSAAETRRGGGDAGERVGHGIGAGSTARRRPRPPGRPRPRRRRRRPPGRRRAVPPVPGDRQPHLRPSRRARRRSPLPQRPGPGALDHDVRGREQAAQLGQPVGRGQVEGDRGLAVVEQVEEPGVVAPARRPAGRWTRP